MPSIERPNVIVIVSDTYRPDHIAANGHPDVVTPELDDWLGRSVTFEQATVSSFPTIPMRTDWFTGRFGHPRHGWQDLDPAAVTLPDVLVANGYRTQLIADTTHLMNAHFFHRFDRHHFNRGHEGDGKFLRLNDPIEHVVEDPRKTRVEFGNHAYTPVLPDIHAHTNYWRRYEDQSQPMRMADDVCRFLEDCYASPQPFMLWVDCFDVHEPWFPPQYLLDLYDSTYDGPPIAQPNYREASVYTPAELRNMQARYKAMCTLLSKAVGRMLRTVEDAGLLENSIVVFMSDHGMYLGERGRTGKSGIQADARSVFPFHCEINRICWSMHVPASLNRATVAPGSRLPGLVQAPDLMPTVLELCDIPAPSGVELEGSSLVPLLEGDAKGPRPLAITATTTNVDGGWVHTRAPAVTDGEWKLLVDEGDGDGGPGLYRVADDPGESVNLIAEARDEAQRIHSAMLAWLEAHDATPETLERLSAERVGLD